MSKKPNTITLHEFKGSWREIGRQYGEQFREEIREMTVYWNEKVLAPVFTHCTIKDFEEAAGKFVEPVKAYAPELLDEMEGIAEGSGLPINEILFQNGAYELDIAGPAYLGGCTSFAAAGHATKGGRTISGQNYDWYEGAKMAVMKLIPDDGPAMLGASVAGQLMLFGINEYGVSHYANALVYPKAGIGIPITVIGQKALAASNIPNAIRSVVQCNRAISLNHLLAGKEGDIISVESTPDQKGFVLPDRDILTHANNFQTPYLQSSDMVYQTFFVHSFLRQYRLKQLMEDHYGEIDENVMMELMQDHRGYPGAICAHVAPNAPSYEKGCTILSIVSVPGEGKMWLSTAPCEYEYKEFRL